MALEAQIAADFTYTALTTDASLSSETDITKRVVDEVLPSGVGVDEPYIAFDVTPLIDVNGVGAVRIMSTFEVLVRAIKQTESFADADLKKFARRIDAALHDVSGTTSDGEVFSVVRERPFRLTEIDDNGLVYRHVGGFYSVFDQDN